MPPPPPPSVYHQYVTIRPSTLADKGEPEQAWDEKYFNQLWKNVATWFANLFHGINRESESKYLVVYDSSLFYDTEHLFYVSDQHSLTHSYTRLRSPSFGRTPTCSVFRYGSQRTPTGARTPRLEASSGPSRRLVVANVRAKKNHCNRQLTTQCLTGDIFRSTYRSITTTPSTGASAPRQNSAGRR